MNIRIVELETVPPSRYGNGVSKWAALIDSLKSLPVDKAIEVDRLNKRDMASLRMAVRSRHIFMRTANTPASTYIWRAASPAFEKQGL